MTRQLTSADSASQSSIGGFVINEYRKHLRYPLHLDVNEQFAADGSFSLATTTHQGYYKNDEHRLAGFTLVFGEGEQPGR